VVDSTSSYSGIEFNQRMLCTIRNKYAIMITLSWMGDGGIGDMESIIDSMSFESKQDE
jgi:hypothetical protein